MNQLQVFQNNSFGELEILDIDGKIYFPATDVASLLGYQKPHDAITRHCKELGTTFHGVRYPSGTKNKKFIDEGNLYRLIVNSKLPQAEKFESWVFDEVLPQIRQTGKYEEPKSPMEIMRLQFEALDETNKRVDKMTGDVEYLKKEVPLSTGEYNYISKQVNKAVYEAVDTFGLSNRREVTSELYKDINRGVNEIAGIKTRTQLKQRHFYPVYEFINQWNPSTAVLIKVRQLTLDLSEDQEDQS